MRLSMAFKSNMENRLHDVDTPQPKPEQTSCKMESKRCINSAIYYGVSF